VSQSERRQKSHPPIDCDATSCQQLITACCAPERSFSLHPISCCAATSSTLLPPALRFPVLLSPAAAVAQSSGDFSSYSAHHGFCCRAEPHLPAGRRHWRHQRATSLVRGAGEPDRAGRCHNLSLAHRRGADVLQEPRLYLLHPGSLVLLLSTGRVWQARHGLLSSDRRPCFQ
jgi:hypothetical protein